MNEVGKPRNAQFGPFLYGLDDEPPSDNLPLILKLHGSSNWKLKDKEIFVRTQSWGDLDAKPGYRGYEGTGSTLPIFLPFWDKRIEEAPWLAMWKTAYRRLSTAKQMIVWGYSLPPTDLKAQQLFALSLGTEAIDLCVVDPAPLARLRWRDLLPKARYWEYESANDFLKEPPSWWKPSKPTRTASGSSHSGVQTLPGSKGKAKDS